MVASHSSSLTLLARSNSATAVGAARSAVQPIVLAWLVQGKDFRLIEGKELIKTFEAPIIEAAPPYRQCFCGRCGCPVPNPAHVGAWYVPAGLLDDDPNIKPDKHIYVELKAPWDTIADQLPQMTKQEIRAHRARTSRAKT